MMIWFWPKVKRLCLCYGLEQMESYAMNDFMVESSCFDAYHVYGFCLDLIATYSYGLWKDHAHANGREVMVRRYYGIPEWDSK